MKKNKNVIIIITLLVLVPACIAASYIIYDWYSYTSQDHKIKNYILSLEGVDENEISSDKYCSYSHQKYSKGALGCSVGYEFSVSDSSVTFNDKLLKEIGWKYSFDNTQSLNRYSDKKYLKHVVFETGKMTCSYSIIADQTKNNYRMGCSGPAKAEWFSVNP